MGSIYRAIIEEHGACGLAVAEKDSKNFNCVAITPDDELLCTQCGKIIKV
tara:strand:+ start:3931 stop:4080 length:150 start_codon:yes stop_codon:yes gene_type:complete